MIKCHRCGVNWKAIHLIRQTDGTSITCPNCRAYLDQSKLAWDFLKKPLPRKGERLIVGAH